MSQAISKFPSSMGANSKLANTRALKNVVYIGILSGSTREYFGWNGLHTYI